VPEGCNAFRAALQADPNYSAAQRELNRVCADGAVAKLEDLMRFLEGNLAAIGRVNYTSQENNATVAWRYELSDVRVNPAECRIDFHIFQARNGVPINNADNWVLLSRVDRVRAFTHPGNAPSLFGVGMEAGTTKGAEFIFLDKALADRVGGWFASAIDLCRAQK
jgi:hypothetical protein